MAPEAHRRHRRRERETSSDQPGAATFNQSGLPSTTTSGGSATLTHLAAGRNVKATASAVRARDPRLATLLAQSNAGNRGGELAAAQLAIWRASPAGAYVSARANAAFGLLAGEVAPPPEEVARLGGKNNDDNNGLTWRENFGLHLWFGRAPTATLASVAGGIPSRHREGRGGVPGGSRVFNDRSASPKAQGCLLQHPRAGVERRSCPTTCASRRPSIR